MGLYSADRQGTRLRYTISSLADDMVLSDTSSVGRDDHELPVGSHEEGVDRLEQDQRADGLPIVNPYTDSGRTDCEDVGLTLILHVKSRSSMWRSLKLAPE